MLLDKYIFENPDPILQQLGFCTEAMHAPRLARAFFFGLMIDGGIYIFTIITSDAHPIVTLRMTQLCQMREV